MKNVLIEKKKTHQELNMEIHQPKYNDLFNVAKKKKVIKKRAK